MDLKLPNLGEGADSGTVVNLFVKEGDKIEKDQPVIELENEKAVATIPSTAAGVVTKVYIKNGDKLSVGQRIISVTEAVGGGPAPAAVAKPKAEAAGSGMKQAAPQTAEELPKEEIGETAAPVSQSNGEVAAAPSIRKMADDLGLDLARIRG